MKNIYLIVVLMILLSNVGLAYSGNIKEIFSDKDTDRYLITELPGCFDKVLIKVRGVNGVGNISFINFELNDKGLYEAPCYNIKDNQIILQVNNKQINEYDIVIEHHVNESLDLNSVRTLNFNNVAINPQEIKVKSPKFIVNWTLTIVLTLLCISVLVFIVFGLRKMVKYESKEDREDREFLERKDKGSGEQKLSTIDEELDAVMNSIKEEDGNGN